MCGLGWFSYQKGYVVKVWVGACNVMVGYGATMVVFEWRWRWCHVKGCWHMVDIVVDVNEGGKGNWKVVECVL